MNKEIDKEQEYVLQEDTKTSYNHFRKGTVFRIVHSDDEWITFRSDGKKHHLTINSNRFDILFKPKTII